MTIEIMDNGFSVTAITSTTPPWYKSEPYTPATTYLETDRIFPVTRKTVYSFSPEPPRPTCSLPKIVPECQRQWVHYITKPAQYYLSYDVMGQPPCTEASMNAELCSIARRSWSTYWVQPQWKAGHQRNNITIASRFATATFANSTAYGTGWPTSSTLAPGCTVGCFDRAITGGTVRLLYWPVSVTPPSGQHAFVATMLNTLLTWPTVSLPT